MDDHVRGASAAEPRALVRSPRPLAAPAIAPDGARIVLPGDAAGGLGAVRGGHGRRRADAGSPTRSSTTSSPVSSANDRILAVMGEGRHRRSYLYDLATGERTRFFHNNTVRTIAPEYAWAPRPDGSVVAIVSERDGDTVSPERGLYLTDLRRTVSGEELLARVRASLKAERDLRTSGDCHVRPGRGTSASAGAGGLFLADLRVRPHTLQLRFQARHAAGKRSGRSSISRPTLRSFGYEPELQWFEPSPGVRSANVVATLRGTSDPDVQYVVGSHFDSVREGPGADDNTSGTTALLEAARVLARRPQAATIRFVWFTAEESGLRGSKEFVRVAKENGSRVVGGLNNDMLGWANDDRLDNTIRYANPGLRDLQHAAAFLFTRPDHLRRPLLQVHRRALAGGWLRRRRLRHRLLSGAGKPALPPAARRAGDRQPPPGGGGQPHHARVDRADGLEPEPAHRRQRQARAGRDRGRELDAGGGARRRRRTGFGGKTRTAAPAGCRS